MLSFNRRVHVDGTGAPVHARGQGSPAIFEKRLITLLFQIDASETGGRLLAFLDGVSHNIVIRPPEMGEDMSTYGGGYAAPDSAQDAFYAGKRMRSGSGAFYGSKRGTGAGSDVTIRFNAAIAAFNAKNRADYVLIHELTHAARQSSGSMRGVAMKGFRNREEFYGMCVENMYASEQGLKMRAAYAGDFVDSVSWVTTSPQYDKAMARLYIETTGFMPAMAKATTSFNPFKDWMTKSKLAF
jgi:hypothetical protein